MIAATSTLGASTTTTLPRSASSSPSSSVIALAQVAELLRERLEVRPHLLLVEPAERGRERPTPETRRAGLLESATAKAYGVSGVCRGTAQAVMGPEGIPVSSPPMLFRNVSAWSSVSTGTTSRP